MRISTNVQFDSGIRAMTTQQAEMSRLQQQISSSRRVLTPADDPIAASREVTLTNNLSQTEQMLRNQSDVDGKLTAMESQMTTIQNALQAFQSEMVLVNNPSYNDANRETTTKKLESLLTTIMTAANAQDESGNFMFSGFANKTQPFLQDGSGAVSYQGDTGVREIQVGPSRTIASNMTGNYLFVDIPTGVSGMTASAGATNTGNGFLNSATVADPAAWRTASQNGPFTVTMDPAGNGAFEVTDGSGTAVHTGTLGEKGGSISFGGVNLAITGAPAAGDTFTFGASGSSDMFSTLQRAIDAVRVPDANNGGIKRSNLFREVGADLQAAVDRNLEAITTIGSRRAEIEALTGQDTKVQLDLKTAITKEVGMDEKALVEAISELSLRQMSLTAAQKVYAQVGTQSLFDILR